MSIRVSLFTMGGIVNNHTGPFARKNGECMGVEGVLIEKQVG